jgi:hypothetical protein
MLRNVLKLVAVVIVITAPLWGQKPAIRIQGGVDDGQLQILRGNVHPLARSEFEQGSAPSDLTMEHMLLVLTRSAAQESALETLLKEQQDPSSAQYHQWLTPQEFGTRFGAADADIQTITSWLQSQGFTVNSVSNGKTVIDFSGTAGQVQQAFHTQIHQYVVNGQQHWANATNPQIPAALSSVVAGVATLHNFTKQTQLINSGRQFEAQLSSQGRPQFTAGTGNNALSPGDYAVIYNLNPLFAAGINGSGRTIAVVGRTNIKLSDITGSNGFRSVFGLSGGLVQVIVNGTDPGDLGSSEEAEAVLDTSWAGATAPGATVDLVVSKTTNTTDGVDLSELYIIDRNLADVMTESFGDCEANYTKAEGNYYSSLAEQAAAEGITYFVAAGDAGSAGCNSGSDNTSDNVLSVNILSSNPYVVAVGGTQFNENGAYSTYWSSTNSSTDVSALSYIPEDVWNESCTISTGINPCTNGNTPGLWAGGGGASTLFPKPTWQTGVTGIPNDGARDVPDVSLTAAGHDPYLLCLDQSCTPNSRGRISFEGYSGTSAATPSMAGITATILQEIGGRLGLINSSLYQLAASESLSSCNASNASSLPANTCIFNDITVGNNAVPGETGYTTASGKYQATVGYDLASGLGSVNAANLAAGLTGTGVGTPVLNVSTSTINFGGVNLGVATTQQLTISNTGNGYLIISHLTITGASTQYTAALGCSTVILPNKTCTVNVTFTPTISGSQAAMLTIATNASSMTVSLSGIGVATATALISNTSLNFGSQIVVTRSDAQSVTITNSTLQTLYAASISVTGAAASDFVIGSNCGSTIPSGSSCTVYVIFTPSFAGSRYATLYLPTSSSGPETAISLSGTGLFGGSFEIVSMHTGKVLEVAAASNADGASIQQNALNGFEQQQWQFLPTGDGYYVIQNVLTGKVLDVTGGYTTGGTLIQQWDFLGGANQQWQLIPMDDVHYAIINRNSGLALDVLDGSTANGVPIQQWPYLGDQQQLWVLVPAGSYNITNDLSSYVLDVPSGSTVDGTLIQQWSSDGYRQQQWQLIPVGGGYFAIMNRNSGKVLDVIGGSNTGGALIQQWDYIGGENQQWQLVPLDATNYKIVNRQSGLVLDDTNSSITAGTHIQQWGFVADKNQQWQLNPIIYYNIVNKNSGLVLDVVNGSTSAGAMIQQWPSNGYQQQQWQLVLVTNGYYALMNNLSSLVLDVTNSSTADGVLIEQNSYLADPSQQWQFISIAGGYYEIQNLNSGKVLDMTGGYLYGGALLQQWDYLAGANQKWQLVPVTF